MAQAVSAQSGNPDPLAAAANKITDYFELNYISPSGGFDTSGNIDVGDLLYEAQLYTHLNWWNNYKQENDSQHRSILTRLYVPVKIQLRQYSTFSNPVKTPTFNPGLKMYFIPRDFFNTPDDFSYVSFGFHHYSNGQNGSHIDPDTNEVNTENGSFSSDYVELSLYSVNDSPIEWMKLNARAYLTGLTWEEEQTDYYENFLLEISGRSKTATIPTGWWLEDIYIQSSLGYKFGRKYIDHNEDAEFLDNLQFSAEVVARPERWVDMKLFARVDIGYDNYNIYYRNQTVRLQVGFTGSLF